MIWLKSKHIFYISTILLLIIISSYQVGFHFSEISEFSNGLNFLNQWFPPDTEKIKFSLLQAITTLNIAFLGTIFSALIALPLSFFAAKNVNTSNLSMYMIRFIFSFLRAIPEFVFGLVFLTIIGTGATAAVIAIIIHNIGVFSKKFSELIEASEPGPFIAIKSVGASHASACCFGILPQIFPNILSEYFYRFEVAFRASLVLGIIGGGGIGQQLMNHFQTFQYQSVCMDLIIIIIFVFFVDWLSQVLRSKVI
jgi:phosphonate transport system permease protein